REEAVHDAVPLLEIEALREVHGALDVGEEDGDLLSLTLEGGLRGEDLLSQVLRGVGAGISVDLVRRRRRQRMPARRAELGRRADGVAAARAAAGHRRPTLLAELRGRAVLVLATSTPHCKGSGVHALPQLLEQRLRLPQVELWHGAS